MAELKTQKNGASIEAFLAGIEPVQKRSDAQALFEVFKAATDEEPSMWGDSIVGFGGYHYKYKSGQEGDWPLTAFSPRKASISIYIMPGINKYSALLDKLGKHKKRKGSCLYINKLEDIDTEVLKTIILQSVIDIKKIYPTD